MTGDACDLATPAFTPTNRLRPAAGRNAARRDLGLPALGGFGTEAQAGAVMKAAARAVAIGASCRPPVLQKNIAASRREQQLFVIPQWRAEITLTAPRQTGFGSGAIAERQGATGNCPARRAKTISSLVSRCDDLLGLFRAGCAEQRLAAAEARMGDVRRKEKALCALIDDDA